MNPYNHGVEARAVWVQALTGCFLLVLSGCAAADRDATATESPRSDQTVRTTPVARDQGQAKADPHADRSQDTHESPIAQPVVSPIPETHGSPSTIGVAATPEQDQIRQHNTQVMEERLKEAVAEIEEAQMAQAEQELKQEITGLIVEETMTKIGYEFFEYFFLMWEPPQVKVPDYNILIAEKATPTWGSVVEVKIAETVIFARMLKPRSEEIEEAVKEAVATVREYLENYEQQQLRTPDLTASGI